MGCHIARDLAISKPNAVFKYFLSLFLIWTIVSAQLAVSCPDGCACVHNDHVICNLGGLVEIPVGIPPDTQYISLNDNSIRRLSTDSFKGLAHLKFIYLEKNNITNIAPYSFRGLSNMEEITIERNPLDHLGSYSLASLKGVHRIYLGYNKINAIRANAFFGSEDVREISLIGNPLTILHSNAFSGFTNVHFFYFPKGISTIEKDAFNSLKNVRMLRLDNITTNQLDQHTFRGLSYVAGLEIRGSHIGIIRKGAFDGLSNVDYLGIDHCTLEKIQKDAFKGLQNVSAFVINSNTIDGIEDHSFWGLEAKSQVQHLNFSNNRIPCDCQLHNLIDNLEKSAPTFIDVNYCNFPKEANGHLVSKIKLDLLEKCPSEPPQIQTFMQHHHTEPEVADNVRKSEVKNVAHYMSGNGRASSNSFVSSVPSIALLMVSWALILYM